VVKTATELVAKQPAQPAYATCKAVNLNKVQLTAQKAAKLGNKERQQ
jgi:hypothetical protein